MYSPNGIPVASFADVLCEKLRFCHELPLRDVLAESPRNNFTIGLENMIISKAQYIKKVAASTFGPMDRSRILGKFDNKTYLVGMKPKDMLDVSATLLDHEVGFGSQVLEEQICARFLGISEASGFHMRDPHIRIYGNLMY